jgi:hypothetical protein
MASMPPLPPQPDVRSLQRSMVMPSVSQAHAIVQQMLRFLLLSALDAEQPGQTKGPTLTQDLRAQVSGPEFPAF